VKQYLIENKVIKFVVSRDTKSNSYIFDQVSFTQVAPLTCSTLCK